MGVTLTKLGLEDLRSLHSDLYKEWCGCRPNHTANWSIERFEAGVSDLLVMVGRQEKERELDEALVAVGEDLGFGF